MSKDQTTVSKDETALGQALDAESSSGTTSTTGTSRQHGPTQGGHTVDATDATTGNTGTGSHRRLRLAHRLGRHRLGRQPAPAPRGADTDTPEQIASDQASIDSAEADLINAEQSLNETTLTSPIAGTVVSVDIAVGDTVSADSSTDIITIIGTKSYEVQGTLDSSQVPSVKVGQSASVQVDGTQGSVTGTVSQVGPVQSSDGEYSYPVVVELPASSEALFTGSTANVLIDTGSVSNVVAVPTSAVETTGTRSYVLEIDKGVLTTKVIKVGMVGDTYTQVLSGLNDGQSVVLADYAEAVPSSNTDLTNALGGGGGFGGFGGGGVRWRRGRRRRDLPHQRAVPAAGVSAAEPNGRPPHPAAQSPAPDTTVVVVAAIRLDQVNLVVHDVPASRAFYARLGLDFGDEPDPVWDAHHVSARHGDTTPLDLDLDSVTFAAKWNQGASGGSGAILGFKVDTRADVDALVAALAADGVPVQQEPYDAFWGARYAVVSDPDGNGVGIMSPVDPARRSEAPSPS